jgi:hypothetical protein
MLITEVRKHLTAYISKAEYRVGGGSFIWKWQCIVAETVLAVFRHAATHTCGSTLADAATLEREARNCLCSQTLIG